MAASRDLIRDCINEAIEQNLSCAEVAYRKGYEDALRTYAIYKDGIQVVGCMEKPLLEVLKEFQRLTVPVRY